MDAALHSRSRILIVGTSGSGKTTLARKLAAKHQLTDIELDALFWEPNWVQASQSVFRDRIERAMSAAPGWVVHGNYSKIQDLTWARAEIVIWLDFPLPLVLWRVTKRSLIRLITRETLWSGNRESWRMTFFKKESIILWALQSHRRNRQRYETMIHDRCYPQTRVIRLKSPREVDGFFDKGVCRDRPHPPHDSFGEAP